MGQSDDNQFCCAAMARWSQPCAQHTDDPIECPDRIIHQTRKAKLTGIRIFDGGSSFVAIAFCPWCSTALPASDLAGQRMIEVSMDNSRGKYE